MPKKTRWEYSTYRATLKRDGAKFAFVSCDSIGNNLGVKDSKTLLQALRSEEELQACCMELSRLTGCATDGRNWKPMLEKLMRQQLEKRGMDFLSK